MPHSKSCETERIPARVNPLPVRKTKVGFLGWSNSMDGTVLVHKCLNHNVFVLMKFSVFEAQFENQIVVHRQLLGYLGHFFKEISIGNEMRSILSSNDGV
jgi:hypothetical protein